MNPDHWLDAAERLLHRSRRGAPRQVDLRCVVSLIHYALFHWLANCAADALAGATKPRDRSWTRVYRGLQHRQVREQFRRGRRPGGLPSSIHRFAAAIVAMQARRHSADYDPDTRFLKGDVAAFLANANRVIRDLQGTTPDPEAIRDAKGVLSSWMPADRSYRPSRDQAALAAVFDLHAARSEAAASDRAGWPGAAEDPHPPTTAR